jgi:hypothetical protein
VFDQHFRSPVWAGFLKAGKRKSMKKTKGMKGAEGIAISTRRIEEQQQKD